jgi:2,3-dihydroxybenzoate decarboxylase
MRKIAIEEHFSTEEHVDYLRSILEKKDTEQEVNESEKALDLEVWWLSTSHYSLRGADIVANGLLEMGEARLREMDEAAIDMQVLSLVSPGVQVSDASTAAIIARKVNDKLSGIIKEYPKRFAGLAALAPQNPREAADELERCVGELGLRGACISSHTKGEYLDAEKYWVILERAEKLDVPLYIHPRAPSPDMLKPYLTYPALALAMYGFAVEAGLHAMRLICSGLFDEYPRLKIILGHLGEALPFWLQRLDSRWLTAPLGKKLKKKPSEYFRDNFFVTTSGMFWQPPFLCTYLALGADRILFAVDYPFESSKEAVRFIEEVPICDGDKEKICHSNSEMLFRL